MGWRLAFYVVRQRAGRLPAIVLGGALALGLLVAGIHAGNTRATQPCSLTVRGFTTVYGDAPVHETIWVDQGTRRIATIDVIDTPGVAGLAAATLPCGTYTLWAPSAPAAATADGPPIVLQLQSDQSIALGQSRRLSVGP